jgi:crossover junction endodeoxyribonuclease RusA
MQQVSLTFSLPPSVNSYWGFSGHRRFLTLQAREFKTQVAHIVSQQPIRFGSKRLAMTIILHFKDKRKSDLDNRIKSLQDALVQAGLMEDDSQFDEITVKRGEIIKGGLCLVKIVALEQN